MCFLNRSTVWPAFSAPSILARPQALSTSSCWVKNHCSLVFWSVTTIYFQLVYHLVQDKCQALKISAFSLHTFLIFVSYIIDKTTVTSQNFKSHHRSCVSWVWPGTRNGSWRLELSNPSWSCSHYLHQLRSRTRCTQACDRRAWTRLWCTAAARSPGRATVSGHTCIEMKHSELRAFFSWSVRTLACLNL